MNKVHGVIRKMLELSTTFWYYTKVIKWKTIVCNSFCVLVMHLNRYRFFFLIKTVTGYLIWCKRKDRPDRVLLSKKPPFIKKPKSDQKDLVSRFSTWIAVRLIIMQIKSVWSRIEGFVTCEKIRAVDNFFVEKCVARTILFDSVQKRFLLGL